MRLAPGLAPAAVLALAPLAAAAVTFTVNGAHVDVLVGKDKCPSQQLVVNWSLQDLTNGGPFSGDTVKVMGVRSSSTCSTINPAPELMIQDVSNPQLTGSTNTTASAMAFSTSADAGVVVGGCDNPDLVNRRSANPLTNVLCVQYASNGVVATDQVNVKFALAPPLAPKDVSIRPGDGHLKISWAEGDAADDIATFDVHVRQADAGVSSGVSQEKITGLNADVDQTDDKQALQNGVDYTVTVVAHDKYGNVSDPSAPVTDAPVGSADFYEHYRDAGGTGGGGCSSTGGSAAIAAGAIVLALILRRKRSAGGGAALVAVLALGHAARADDRPVPRFLVGFKMDRYDPKVDSEPGLTTHPYHDVFGTRAPPRFQLEFDWEVAHPFGSLLIGATAGFWQNYGKSILDSSPAGSPQRSEDTTVLNIFPFGLIATYRFDWLAQRWERWPFIPYAQAGLMRALWVSYNGRGNVSHDDAGSRGSGWTNGYTTALGVAVSLNAVDPDLAREAYLDTGIQRTTIFAEYGWTYLSNFHRGGALILSDRAWRFGLAVEF